MIQALACRMSVSASRSKGVKASHIGKPRDKEQTPLTRPMGEVPNPTCETPKRQTRGRERHGREHRK